MDSTSPALSASDVNFYSEDWRRAKVFAIASLPYYDVMADKDSLYLIEMPKYSGAAWGLILGLILLNIIGAAIGAAIGGSSDTKKRDRYRGAWLDNNNEIISRAYEKNIFLKVPLNNLRGNIEVGKNKFTLTHGDKKITLKKGKTEFERFKTQMQAYVL